MVQLSDYLTMRLDLFLKWRIYDGSKEQNGTGISWVIKILGIFTLVLPKEGKKPDSIYP